MPGEDFGCDIIGGTNGRIRHQSPRSSPVVDNGPVTHGKIDLVERDRVPVSPWPRRLALEELLVVVVVVQFVEARRQAEIGKFDVTAPIEEDVVRLDITIKQVSQVRLLAAMATERM